LQTKTKEVSVVDLIKQLQSYEEYAFSWEELLEFGSSPPSTLKKELARLCKKNELLNLRKGFYLILPPRYSSLGKLPIQLYIQKLFKYIDKPYYLSLFSAAAIHGAAHQKTQKEYIVTVPPALRDISKNNFQLEFVTAKNWDDKSINQHKSDAGMYNVSSPALTAIDLVHYHQKTGGINRILANIEELAEEIILEDLNNLLTWYPSVSAIQRLGYILEELQVDEQLVNCVFNHLQNKKHYPILLTIKKGQKPGSTGNRWKVDVNIELDSDL
jgi:predicted transcriptional regulator of viral defense system